MVDREFFEQILANPDDHVLPLIYADWLEERDDPRGEFVRLQSEIAPLDRDSPVRKEREPRLRHLLTELAPLPNVLVDLDAFTIPQRVLGVMPETMALV